MRSSRLAAGSVFSILLLASFGATTAEVASPDEAAVLAARKALKVGERETIIFLEDLHCAACAKKVTGRLFKLKGVMRVRTSVKLDAAVVTPQANKPFDSEAAWAALQEAGYQPMRLDGPAGVYVVDAETKAPTKVAEKPTTLR